MNLAPSTPGHYPTAPPRLALFQDFYDQLADDTLLWIFHYMPRTVAMRGAIHALSARRWLFHTLHQRWYCRLGDRAPAPASADPEQGHFGYLDAADWQPKTTQVRCACRMRRWG